MSAYIVDHSTINRILAGITNPGTHRLRHLPPVLACEDSTGQRQAALGQQLHTLCVQSVQARYPQDTKLTLPGPSDMTYRYEEKLPPPAIHLYKAIRCYLYQTCESEETREDPLYKALEEVADSLAHSIVQGLTEYDRAIWG